MSDILEPGFVTGDDSLVTREGAIMDVSLPVALTEATLQRICSEYIEMPGLCLTCKQAQRLWGLDEATCWKALDLLVEAKFLNHTHNLYRRLTEGPIAFPPFRMARAQLEQNAGAVRVGARAGFAS